MEPKKGLTKSIQTSHHNTLQETTRRRKSDAFCEVRHVTHSQCVSDFKSSLPQPGTQAAAPLPCEYDPEHPHDPESVGSILTRMDIAGKALLSKSAAARVLGLSVHSVDAMIREGQLETRQVAGRTRPKVTRLSIDRYLERPPEQMTPEEYFRRRRAS